jgi:ABC-type transporter Mla subunit MlaD
VTTDPIEGYLDQLLTHLRGSAQDVRRILSEVEEHLRDATAELEAAGASE